MAPDCKRPSLSATRPGGPENDPVLNQKGYPCLLRQDAFARPLHVSPTIVDPPDALRGDDPELEAARKQLSEAGKDLLEATGKVAAKENSLLLARAALAAARTNTRARQSAIGAPLPLRIARILANIGLRATPTGGDLCEAHPGAGKIRAAVQIDK